MFSFVAYRNVGRKDACFPGPTVSLLGYINTASNGINGKSGRVEGSKRLLGKGRGPLHHAQPNEILSIRSPPGLWLNARL